MSVIPTAPFPHLGQLLALVGSGATGAVTFGAGGAVTLGSYTTAAQAAAAAPVQSVNGNAGAVIVNVSANVTGLRKGAGAGSADTAATAGTDYLAPTGNGSQLTGLTQSQVAGLRTTDSPTFASVPMPESTTAPFLKAAGSGTGLSASTTYSLMQVWINGTEVGRLTNVMIWGGSDATGASPGNIKATGFRTYGSGVLGFAATQSVAIDVCVARHAAGATETNTGSMGSYADHYLRSLIATGPIKPGSYTVSTLPSASSYSSYIAVVTNPASGKSNLVYCNGTNWLYMDGSTAA